MSNFEHLHRVKRSDSVDYYSFYDLQNSLITGNIVVIIGSNGQFDNIISTNSKNVSRTYSKDQYTYTRESLYVLGVGYLIPGDVVKLKRFDRVSFTVGYGWHTNISNQSIYSWYLVPNDSELPNPYSPDGKILTLYQEYLETIELVSYTKDRSSFYIGGEPNA